MHLYFNSKVKKYLLSKINRQPYVYDLIIYLINKSSVKNIFVIGSMDTNQLNKFDKNLKIVNINPQLNNSALLNKSMLKESIVICINTLEKIKNSHYWFKQLAYISTLCKFLIVTTPDKTKLSHDQSISFTENNKKAKWNMAEFQNQLNIYKFSDFVIGYTIDNDLDFNKNLILVISGSLMNTQKRSKLSIVAFMQVYNEKDIIKQTVTYLLNQGIDVRIFDNWSNDGTYELLKKIAYNNKGLVLSRFPLKKPSHQFTLIPFLKTATKYLKNSKYDWFIYQGGADEIIKSPWKNINLKQGIEIVDALGFNAIDYVPLEFKLLDDGFKSNNDPELFFDQFEFGKNPGHFLQVNTWKNLNNTTFDLTSFAGHQVLFNNRKVYPIKFYKKHYPFRSRKQVINKLFNRINRSDYKEISGGLHAHYFKYLKSFNSQGQCFWLSNNLIKFIPETFYQLYLIERISGISLVEIDPKIKQYEEKIEYLKKSLNKLLNSKFYKLWQNYNQIKKFIFRIK